MQSVRWGVVVWLLCEQEVSGSVPASVLVSSPTALRPQRRLAATDAALGVKTRAHIESQWSVDDTDTDVESMPSWFIGEEPPNSEVADALGVGACSSHSPTSFCGGIGIPFEHSSTGACVCRMLPFKPPKDCDFRCATIPMTDADPFRGRLVTDKFIGKLFILARGPCKAPFCAHGEFTVDDVLLIDKWARKDPFGRGVSNTIGWYDTLSASMTRDGTDIGELRESVKPVFLPVHPDVTVEQTTARATADCQTFDSCFPYGATSPDSVVKQNPVLHLHNTLWDQARGEVTFTVAKGAREVGGVVYPPIFVGGTQWRSLDGEMLLEADNFLKFECTFEGTFEGAATRTNATLYQCEDQRDGFSIGCKVPEPLHGECLEVTLHQVAARARVKQNMVDEGAAAPLSLSYPQTPACIPTRGRRQGTPTTAAEASASKVSMCTQFMTGVTCRQLKEWIEYNMIIGVTHLYLYDNSRGTLQCNKWDGEAHANVGAGDYDGYGDPDVREKCNRTRHSSREALQPYIDAGVVTYIDWQHGAHHLGWAQTSQMLDCLYQGVAAGDDFMMQNDIDEFMAPGLGYDNLPEMMGHVWDRRLDREAGLGGKPNEPLCWSKEAFSLLFNGQYFVGDKNPGGQTQLDTFTTGYPVDHITPFKKMIHLESWVQSEHRVQPGVHAMCEFGWDCGVRPKTGHFNHYHVLETNVNYGERPEKLLKYTDLSDRFGEALAEKMAGARAQC